MAKAGAKGEVSYEAIHREILAARTKLVDQFGEGSSTDDARIEAAIRNLDVARVVLECNQSLNATDYNVEPWTQLPSMELLLAGKSRRARKK